MANTLEVSLALKAAGYRKEIQNVKKDNQLLEAHFKNLSSTVEGFENTLEGKQERLKLVSGQYKNAQKMLEIYKTELASASQDLEKANRKFQGQEEALKSTKAQLEEYRKAFGPTSEVVKTLEKEVEALEKEFKKQANAVVTLNSHYKETQLQVTKAETKINELGRELKGCATDTYNFDGKLKGLASGLKDVEKKLDSVNKELLDFGAKMSQVGQGLMQVGDNLTNLGKKGISSISNLVKKGAEWDAAMAQTEMVYGHLGKATQDVINKQEELATTLGLTSAQMKGATTEIASYFKAMGMADEQIASLLPSQAQLIADMAAFADVDVTTALGDYKSALQGNREAVDKYNIAIGETTINESSYAKEIGKTLGQMTEQEKIQARMNVMMEHSADYTGLAQQEAGEFSAQLKLLSAKFDEAAKKIGETLLPVLEPLIQMISEVVDKIVAWVEQNPQLTATLLAVTGVISALFLTLGPVFSLLGNAAVVFGSLATAAAGAGTTILGMIGSSLVPLIATIGAIVGIVGVVALAIKENWEGIKEATNQLLETCRPYFERLGESFQSLWRVCQELYEVVIQPLFHMIGEVIEVFVELSAPLFNFLAETFIRMIEGIVSTWDTLGKPLFDTMMFVIESLFDFVKPIFELLASIFGEAIDTMFKFYDTVLSPMFSDFSDDVFKLIEVVRPTFEQIRDSVVGALEKVDGAIRSTIDWFRDLFGWINDGISKMGEFLSNLNPFKSRAMEFETTMNQKMAPISSTGDVVGNIALSGSYYTPRTPASENLTRVSSIIPQQVHSTSAQVPVAYSQDCSNLEAVLEKYLGLFVSAIQSHQPDFYLDGQKVTQKINQLNGQGMKLNERWG